MKPKDPLLCSQKQPPFLVLSQMNAFDTHFSILILSSHFGLAFSGGLLLQFSSQTKILYDYGFSPRCATPQPPHTQPIMLFDHPEGIPTLM